MTPVTTAGRPAWLDVQALAPAKGVVALPGSKSISNRCLLLAALAEGETLLEGVLASDDTRVMLNALQSLGVSVQAVGEARYVLRGCGGVFPVKSGDLFLGNAGTAFRPLTAALALSGGEYRLSGVPRMHERPIGDLVDGLSHIGCRIDYTGEKGYPPLAVHPACLTDPLRLSVRGNVSSQFLTASLMALPLTGQEARIEVSGELISKPYIDITLNLMRCFGVDVAHQDYRVFDLPSGTKYRSPGRLQVEGDASSASYFLAAGALGGPVRVTGVGEKSIQGDIRFTEALAAMGARITMGEDWIEAEAPQSGRLMALNADFNHIPDAAMTIAVLALFAEGTTVIRNVASWRVKETDRLTAMATELRKLGAEVVETEDSLSVTPPVHLADGAAIDTYDDHRMAMCFSLAAFGGVRVRINDPACVNKTFPDYFERLATIAKPGDMTQ